MVDEWLCHRITNKLWNLDKFKQIRIVVSTKFVANTLQIKPHKQYYSSITGILKNNRPTQLHDFCQDWLEDKFPTYPTLWVWIEEA